MTAVTDTTEADPFISIGTLLTRPLPGASRPISTATLATAIEKYGVQGWDGYGRFALFTDQDKGDTPGSADKAIHYKAALGAVKKEADHDWDTWLEQIPEPSPAEDGTGNGTVFDRYGWRESVLPDFAKIDTSLPAGPRRSSQGKRLDNANAALIGVMRLLMVGDKQREDFAVDTAFPVYRSQNDLIGAILDVAEANNFKGLSKSTLESKFAEARKVLNERVE